MAADNAVALERREAQGSPRTRARAHGTSGPRKPSRKLGVRVGRSQGPPRGASQALRRFPALHPLVREKENRDTGKSWPPELKPPGSEALA